MALVEIQGFAGNWTLSKLAPVLKKDISALAPPKVTTSTDNPSIVTLCEMFERVLNL